MQHEWVVMATYNVTPEMIRDGSREDGEHPQLTMDMLRMAPQTGCYVCEAVLTSLDQLETECPGEPTGYDAYGDPVFKGNPTRPRG
jgi:hypothetical protein